MTILLLLLIMNGNQSERVELYGQIEFRFTLGGDDEEHKSIASRLSKLVSAMLASGLLTVVVVGGCCSGLLVLGGLSTTEVEAGTGKLPPGWSR